MVVKLHLSGDCQHFKLANILAGLNITFKQFQSMCVLAGCDYLKNVQGVGIHTAYKMVCANEICLKLLKEEVHLHHTWMVIIKPWQPSTIKLCLI